MIAEQIVLCPLLDIADRQLNHQANEKAGDDAAAKLLLDLALRTSNSIEDNAILSALLVGVVLSRDLPYTLS